MAEPEGGRSSPLSTAYSSSHRRIAKHKLAATLVAALAVAGIALIGWHSNAKSGSGSKAQRADPPNILIVITDDQRDGTMRAMPKTRRIFGNRGTRFTNGVVTTPQCCPSRASIFSGQYIHNHGVVDNSRGRDLDDTKTLHYELRRAGYKTAMVGKYLNGFDRRKPAPHFHRSFLGANANGALHDPRQDYFHANKASKYLSRFHRQDPDRPWALIVAFRSPHRPYIPAPRYRDARVPGRYQMTPATRERNLSDKHPKLRRAAVQRDRRRGARIRRGHMRMLMSADDGVARIFRELRRTDDLRDTLALFVSDNGWFWGEHGIRQGKFLPYLDAIRVPLYMRWPGRVANGGVDRRLAANIDIAPTVYDAAGIEPGYTVDGRSLLGDHRRDWVLLEGSHERHRDRPDWPLWRSAYYDRRTHFIRWRGGREEHYNLRNDRFELNGRSRPEAAAQLRRILNDAERCSGASCP